MNWDVLTYIKKNWVATIILAILFSWLYFFKHDNFAFIIAGLVLFDLVKGYFKYKKKLSYLAGLKKNGFTEEMVDNRAFVEKWDKISKKGIYRYCLIEGGIPLALELIASFFVLGIVILIWLVPSTGPFEFSQLVWFSCFLGVIAGIAGARYLWYINQKKFSDLKTSLGNEQNL